MTATQRRSSAQHIAAVRTRKHATALLLAGSLLAVAGCSDSDKDASPSTSSPTQTSGSPSPSSTTDAEDAAVIATYTSSWTAQTEAYSKASSAGTDLKKNTTLRALFDIEHDLEVMRKAGQVTTGKPAINPKVVKVTDAKIPTATVTDCVDTTHWTLIDKASKKKVSLPTSRLIKYVSTATLEKWGTKWMVTKLTAQEQAC
ncbi:MULTISPECIES: hypothetical protein [unclassified Streptomyces]|uniref:hypothetical protein n=1 Tax=unclassified Streptomyces TaxID=2593676 RepID=UPI002E812A02|nr:hypothetical protein [Streptomyces sp. NBC_00589]WTI42376.1 hypothetical protein OIC96_49550 [Streptomyces sp. NBC_00775]WUB23942.1 hypothetical protein OHA51_00180 [Streptomyces sp. NBC_00589]